MPLPTVSVTEIAVTTLLLASSEIHQKDFFFTSCAPGCHQWRSHLESIEFKYQAHDSRTTQGIPR
jgi:4-hydroxy-3-methylbut-2-en-1-yl diphosphate synthase IspG/GcpE